MSEHVAQPCASFRTIVKIEEDMAPVPHKDGNEDNVLNVLQVLFRSANARVRAGVGEHSGNPRGKRFASQWEGGSAPRRPGPILVQAKSAGD
jgi:hypothetical protein